MRQFLFGPLCLDGAWALAHLDNLGTAGNCLKIGGI